MEFCGTIRVWTLYNTEIEELIETNDRVILKLVVNNEGVIIAH